MKQSLLILILLFVSLFSRAQSNVQDDNQPKKIEIRNSNTLEVTPRLGPDVKILRGNVEFFHDDATMYCDSAYYNTAENFFKAYSNVHCIKPYDNDTLRLWGDSLDYDGKIKYAKIRSNVKMTKDSMVMLTDNIDYDMNENVANYFSGGITYTDQDTLISELGYFYPKTDDLVYNKDVVIKNPDYVLYSDTLTHNIKNKISTFEGPTKIVGKDNLIYAEKGWYNHRLDKSQLTKKAYLVSKEHKLVGDTIFYDRNQKFGHGRGHVEIIDTAKHVRLSGGNIKYYEIPEHSLVTDSALMKYITKTDTLFLHADTLCSIVDTSFTDTDTTVYRIIKGFHHVKMFRSDLQAMCDSLVYNMLDSIIDMYYTPVIWQDNNQLTASTIRLYMVDQGIDMAELINKAFIISKVDTMNHFNQIFGQDMVAYLDSNQVSLVEVIDKSNTIYFTMEDSIATGMNQVQGKDMKIIFKNKKVNKIWFYVSPKGTMYPIIGLDEKLSFLEGFIWLENHRPKQMKDIFVHEIVSEKPHTLVTPEDMNNLSEDPNAEFSKEEE